MLIAQGFAIILQVDQLVDSVLFGNDIPIDLLRIEQVALIGQCVNLCLFCFDSLLGILGILMGFVDLLRQLFDQTLIFRNTGLCFVIIPNIFAQLPDLLDGLTSVGVEGITVASLVEPCLAVRQLHLGGFELSGAESHVGDKQ